LLENLRSLLKRFRAEMHNDCELKQSRIRLVAYTTYGEGDRFFEDRITLYIKENAEASATSVTFHEGKEGSI